MEADAGKLEEFEANGLLERLCTVYGFCLSPLWRARLATCPPQSPQKYAETVFLAEGLDPKTVDVALYKSVLNEIHAAFNRSCPIRPGQDV
jgi:hypothetical protein